MFRLADPITDKRFNRVFLFLFICLFLVAPTYYQDNPGGEGLFLPFNSTVWIAASFLIGLGLLRVVHTGKLVIPSLALPMLTFPVIITLMGALMSVALPVSWMFRLLAIWGGFLVYFSINQFRLERRWQDNLMLVLVASSMVQSLISLAHLYLDHNLWGFIPHSPGIPRGIFQQVNLNASYVATGLLAAIYCLSLPSFRQRHRALRLMIIAAVGLNTLVVATTGSRLGMIAAIAGVLLMLAARYRQLWAGRKALFAALGVVALAAIASLQIETKTGGLLGGVEKFEKMTQSSSDPTRNDVRWMMYDSSLELMLERPITGHGIGRFQPAWHDKKAEYHQQHPEAAILEPRLSHPHNELLYWGIEGGLLALAAIFFVAGAVLWRLWQLGWQRGGAYLALLLPITLHTQVELPFYISQLHWLLFICLIALIASHRRRVASFGLSSFGRATGLAIALVFPVLATVFFTHSLLANKANMDFQLAKVKDVSKLEFPSTNIYFAENTAFLHMQTLLRYGLQTGNTNALNAYIPWAQEHLQYIPDAAVYIGLPLALHKLGRFEEAYRVMDRAIAVYPKGRLTETGKNALNDMDARRGRPPRYQLDNSH